MRHEDIDERQNASSTSSEGFKGYQQSPILRFCLRKEFEDYNSTVILERVEALW